MSTTQVQEQSAPQRRRGGRVAAVPMDQFRLYAEKWRAGETTMSEIASQIGRTRQGVQLRLVSYAESLGCDYADLASEARTSAENRRIGAEQDIARQVSDALAANPLLSTAGLRAMGLPLPNPRVMSWVPNDLRAALRQNDQLGASHPARRYSREDLISRLQRVAKQEGVTPTVTMWRNAGLAPTVPVFMREFGSWRKALDEAGLATVPRTRTRRLRLGREELVKWVAAFLQDNPANPSMMNYTEWVKEHPGAPSSSTIRLTLSWGEAVREARVLLMKNPDAALDPMPMRPHLTDEIGMLLGKRAADGESLRALAEEYGIASSTVQFWLKRFRNET